mmetsp:Transcript_64989/g.171972  ORF Transcript_64989/g.171972 Transcript_64989/m.171972 type:complete len:244 (-) Transcript_64989:511-1242(-)
MSSRSTTPAGCPAHATRRVLEAGATPRDNARDRILTELPAAAVDSAPLDNGAKRSSRGALASNVELRATIDLAVSRPAARIARPWLVGEPRTACAASRGVIVADFLTSVSEVTVRAPVASMGVASRVAGFRVGVFARLNRRGDLITSSGLLRDVATTEPRESELFNERTLELSTSAPSGGSCTTRFWLIGRPRAVRAIFRDVESDRTKAARSVPESNRGGRGVVVPSGRPRKWFGLAQAARRS